MKLSYRKICRSNEGVSEVIGGLMLIVIVASCMTSLMWISNAYIDMQKNIVNTNVEACQRFIEYLNNLFPITKPGNTNTAPEVKDPFPAAGKTGVLPKPTCSVMVSDKDGDKLAVKFFFYTPLDSVWKPYSDLFIVDSNTTVSCAYNEAANYDTKYYWQVTVFDGDSMTTSDVYNFTTVTKNAPPEIKDPIPAIGKTGVPASPSPECSVMVCDEDTDQLSVFFFYGGYTYGPQSTDPSSHQGAPYGVGPFNVRSNTRIGYTFPEVDAYDTTYYWQVSVFDGTSMVTSQEYYFTTASPPT